jgi:hypothetical protein
MTSKVHSTQTMEFPPEVQTRIQNAQARRQAHPQQGPRATQVQPNAPQQSQAPVRPSQQMKAAKPAMAAAQMNNAAIDPALIAAMSGRPPGQGSSTADQQWYQPPKPLAAPVDLDSVIPNPTPGFVVAQADSEGTSVMLPSRFAFYEFQDLYIKPFRAAHLAKLSRAHAERSLQQVVETVSTVIYTTTPGFANLAFKLTMPDFYFCLYWLRQNSFTKAQYVHKDVCTNKSHLEKVESGELEVDSLKLTQIINNTTTRTIELERVPDPEMFTFGEESSLTFSPPKMLDVLEFMDDPLMQDANTRVEFSYLAQQAAHVQGKFGYLTLKDRIDAVENLDLDSTVLIKKYEKLMQSYGVQEKVRLQCKVCGASKDSTLSLDASTFLSVE